ncbi:MAG: cysteine desulfurase family protein [Bryobacteraceae bacterium]
MNRFYFDHNATTPVSGEVLDAMVACLRQTHGNASSIHYYGQAAKQRLEQARRELAGVLGCDANEIVLVSGGTEADNLALFGVVRATRRIAHIITTSIEHPAVLAACRELEREGHAVAYLEPDSNGVVDPEDVRCALRPDTVLVSVMQANNETGVVQPIGEIAAIAHEAGALIHSDGVQAFGKLSGDVRALGVDLYSISGHKIYAPKGIGALYVRNGTVLEPIIRGGHHERDRRAGTENVASAVALAAAVNAARRDLDSEAQRLGQLRDRLENAILGRVPAAGVNGGRAARVPNTTNIWFDGVQGEALVIALDLAGFAVSTGSACSSGAVEPSHVLSAMGLSTERARASLRFSLGRSNTVEQVDALAEAVEQSVARLRGVSARWSACV